MSAEGLTAQEDMFCLGIIEFSGNLRLAYATAFPPEFEGEIIFPEARARELMSQPHIQARIRELMAASVEATFISESAHMSELAEIRDLSKKLAQPKTALAAEMARGQVAGFYKGKALDPALDGVDPEMLKSAKKLQDFVSNFTTSLAAKLPV